MSYGIETRGSKAVKLRSFLPHHTTRTEIFKIQASVVQRLDSDIYRINLYRISAPPKWIELIIYLLDSIKYSLNNWNLAYLSWRYM